MKLYHLLLLTITIILTASIVHADVIVLKTSIELDGGETWEANVQALRGQMDLTISSSEDDLNFTIYQNNDTLVSLLINSEEPVSIGFQIINAGEILIVAQTSDNFFATSDISILLTQPNQRVNPFLVGSAIILFLVIPVVYIFGRNQGLKQL